MGCETGHKSLRQVVMTESMYEKVLQCQAAVFIFHTVVHCVRCANRLRADLGDAGILGRSRSFFVRLSGCRSLMFGGIVFIEGGAERSIAG